MRLDEIDSDVRKCSGVVDAGTRPGLGHLFRKYSQPVAVYSLLLFEGALEDLENAVHRECADSRAANGVYRSRENPVHQSRGLPRVSAIRNVARWLWIMIKSSSRYLLEIFFVLCIYADRRRCSKHHPIEKIFHREKYILTNSAFNPYVYPVILVLVSYLFYKVQARISILISMFPSLVLAEFRD